MKHIIWIILGIISTWLIVIYIGVDTIQKTSNYQKIFVKKQNSLIIGTSRAAKLNADIISYEVSNKILPSGIYNFAFNLSMSPYCPSYNQSIIKHVNFESNEKGVFILCIDPWALSEKKHSKNNSNNLNQHSKLVNFNNNQDFATIKYFLQTYSKPYINLFLPPKSTSNNIKKEKPNKEYIKHHLSAKIASYKRQHFSNKKISDKRFSSLKSLIDTLSTKGKVYLIKIPVSNEMINLEHKFSPDFDTKIKSLISQSNIKLIDFYNYSSSFLCPDGNHLWSTDADTVSLIIADIIQLNESKILSKNKVNLIEAYLECNKGKYRSALGKSKSLEP